MSTRKNKNVRIPRPIPLEPKPEVQTPTIPYKPMLTSLEVAEALNVSRRAVARYAATGLLPFENRLVGRPGLLFRYEDVVEFTKSDLCQKRLLREAIRVSTVGRLPISAAVDRDSLLTIRDAATVLGTSPRVVYSYIYKNRMFAFQDIPAQFGSRCYVLYNAVMRLKSEREVRKKGIPEQLKAEWNLRFESAPWSDCDLNPDPATAPSLFRNHNGYMSTRQVARMMGICMPQVRCLRATGRLQGYQLPFRSEIDRQSGKPLPQKGDSYWFFKKEDVQNLMDDPSYQKRRAAYIYGKSEEARQKRQEKIDEQTMREADIILKNLGYKFDEHGNTIEWPERPNWSGVDY